MSTPSIITPDTLQYTPKGALHTTFITLAGTYGFTEVLHFVDLLTNRPPNELGSWALIVHVPKGTWRRLGHHEFRHVITLRNAICRSSRIQYVYHGEEVTTFADEVTPQHLHDYDALPPYGSYIREEFANRWNI